MGNREDKLKEILKRVPMSEPSHRFTDVVIQEIEEIEAAVAGKVHADEKLKILLQHHPAPAPSNAFTYKVLNTIREKSQVERKPVISKGAWGLIVSFVVICIAAAAFTGNGDSSAENLYVMSVGDYLSKLFGRYTEMIFFLAIALTSGGLLLSLDYFLNKSMHVSDQLGK